MFDDVVGSQPADRVNDQGIVVRYGPAMVWIDTDDLCDAVEVAQILGLSSATAISTYLQRYPQMPRPIVDRGPNRTRFWLRSEIEAWQAGRRPAR